jgi:hypothetical protein
MACKAIIAKTRALAASSEKNIPADPVSQGTHPLRQGCHWQSRRKVMFLKIAAAALLSIGMASSAFAQTAGSAGQGSGSGSGTSQSGTNGDAGTGSNSGSGNGSGATGSGDTGSASNPNQNGQNAGASGGDANDCQRQHAGDTSNPSPTSGDQSNKPDAANACK